MPKIALGVLVAMLGAWMTLGAGCGGGTASTSGGPGGATAGPGSASSGSGAGGGACASAAGDSACTACTKASCCAEAVACAADEPNCACWSACYDVHPGDYSTCLKQCPQPDATTQALSACVAEHCAATCNGATASSSSSSGGVLCTPTASDPSCTSCTKTKCCSEVNACAADMACLCWTNCIEKGGTTTSCTASCGAMDSTTTAFFTCASMECAGSCS